MHRLSKAGIADIHEGYAVKSCLTHLPGKIRKIDWDDREKSWLFWISWADGIETGVWDFHADEIIITDTRYHPHHSSGEAVREFLLRQVEDPQCPSSASE